MNPALFVENAARVANADYTVVDCAPLSLQAGEVVTLGKADRAWEGWVWAITEEGRGTYLPISFLEETGNAGLAKLTENYDARDLSVQKGDRVTCLREVSGWFWCRDGAGVEGWLPDYVLAVAV